MLEGGQRKSCTFVQEGHVILLAYNVKYGARVIDVSLATVTLEFTGTGETIDEFVDYLYENFGIVELARTGITSLQRGEGSFTDDLN